MDWISVEDRMPEEGVSVMFHVLWHESKDQVIHHGWFSGACWRTYYTTAFIQDDKHSKVTHWMPLPAPPELGL